MAHHYTIKQILLDNQAWWNFYLKHQDKIRAGILIAIVKLLSCKNIVRGSQLYVCANPNCTHTKLVVHTCKSKACSSCGKKATEVWIAKQMQTLPDTPWQHITFTMPSQLWLFFWCNRTFLNLIGAIAANCIKAVSDKKNVVPGIFIAIHTFGRDLKCNVHIHLSTTTGGISKDGATWKNLYFHQPTIMKMWRYEIIKMFRSAYNEQALNIPSHIQQSLNHTFTFNHFLNELYQKTWIVHCSKPSKNHKEIVRYLGGYVKRPPIAESKLLHYDGSEVGFKYLDHVTKTYRTFRLSVDEFIGRFIRHIPDVGFRMIRYYGFLANRVRSKYLPCVYQLLEQDYFEANPAPSYAYLIQKDFGFNPLQCILCGSQMLRSVVTFGTATVAYLLFNHRNLALLKKC